jgi:AcrR family transcriptional regulator
MSVANDTSVGRETAILEAAIGVFLRFGFKKTSMDDVAKAVGISRQGLYLYFPNKEALFKAMVMHATQAMRQQAHEALAREDLDVEGRVLAAFEAMHGRGAGMEHLDELIATTAELVGSVVCQLEEGFASDLARVLRSEDIAARWKEAGISAKALAEHLVAVSDGHKRKVDTTTEYLNRMRMAIRMVCQGAPR